MALTMKVQGMEELSEKLNKLGSQAEGVAARALYKGAGVMADAFSSAAGNISTEKFHYSVFGKRMPSPEEKAAVSGKSGIATFDKNGSEVNTVVGFGNAGYVTIGGKRKAVRAIANGINSGTSFMDKQPVFRQAISSARGAAGGAIVARAEELIEQITK